MIKLIADSGSTKTDWCLAIDTQLVKFSTGGMNAAIQTDEQLCEIIEGDLLNTLTSHNVSISRLSEDANPIHIYYYGAGCVGENAVRVANILHETFGKNASIEVNSDMVGAARGLLKDTYGIACILGTGSNSCLYDGERIIQQTPPMGYILGDEGSGAVLGRLFLNALFKSQLPHYLKEKFTQYTNQNLSDILKEVYQKPAPNRFLASLSPFIAQHIDIKEVEDIVIDNFHAFLTKNILPYHRIDLPINAIGSIATIYEKQLRCAAEKEHLSIGKIIKAPIDELVKFHTA